MNRHPAPAIGLLFATVLSGCSYDRSFMQLDSNSGVPFFGFQWAVDSGSRPSKSASGNGDHETSPSLIDLRAPSKLDQPGHDRLEFESERSDLQTVSISRIARTPVYRRSKTSDTQILSTEAAVNDEIHAITPDPHSSRAATMFEYRRAAF